MRQRYCCFFKTLFLLRVYATHIKKKKETTTNKGTMGQLLIKDINHHVPVLSLNLYGHLIVTVLIPAQLLLNVLTLLAPCSEVIERLLPSFISFLFIGTHSFLTTSVLSWYRSFVNHSVVLVVAKKINQKIQLHVDLTFISLTFTF